MNLLPMELQIDLAVDLFLDADGVLQPDIMADKLHPNEKGYVIWAEAVKDQLAELMK